MYSSRIRTGRSLTVCCSLLPGGGLLGPGGVVSAWSRGGRFSLVPGGVCLVPGGGSPETTPLPPVYRITDTCKNITLATTSLRPVIINKLPIDLSQKQFCKIIFYIKEGCSDIHSFSNRQRAFIMYAAGKL